MSGAGLGRVIRVVIGCFPFLLSAWKRWFWGKLKVIFLIGMVFKRKKDPGLEQNSIRPEMPFILKQVESLQRVQRILQTFFLQKFQFLRLAELLARGFIQIGFKLKLVLKRPGSILGWCQSFGLLFKI